MSRESGVNGVDVCDESKGGWTVRCDGCGKEETFPQLTLGEALRAMYGSTNWWRVAPMKLQDKDHCIECAKKARA